MIHKSIVQETLFMRHNRNLSKMRIEIFLIFFSQYTAIYCLVAFIVSKDKHMVLLKSKAAYKVQAATTL